MSDLKKTPADYIADVEHAVEESQRSIANTAERCINELRRLPADLALAERLTVNEADAALVLDFEIPSGHSHGTSVGLQVHGYSVASQQITNHLPGGKYRAVILFTRREDQ